jgi:hypothetical protein
MGLLPDLAWLETMSKIESGRANNVDQSLILQHGYTMLTRAHCVCPALYFVPQLIILRVSFGRTVLQGLYGRSLILPSPARFKSAATV